MARPQKTLPRILSKKDREFEELLRRAFEFLNRSQPLKNAHQGQEESKQVSLKDYDEWAKRLPDGKKVRFSYQLLTSGFSASAEIIEGAHTAMIYTHTLTGVPAPGTREQIEAEFVGDLKEPTQR